MKNFLIKSFLFIVLSLPSSLTAEEVQPAVREYQVKAMFLFNFTKFITWPEISFSSPTTPITICIFGTDPFQGQLNSILKNNTTQGRSIEVRYFSVVDMTRNCHVLFISNSEVNRLASIYDFLQTSPVLTVSDIKDSVRSGGMIEFYTRESKVRFFIDPQTVKEAGLQISSRLLQVADIVSRK